MQDELQTHLVPWTILTILWLITTISRISAKRAKNSARAMDDMDNTLVDNNNVSENIANRTRSSARSVDDLFNNKVIDNNVPTMNAKRAINSARAMDDIDNTMVPNNNSSRISAKRAKNSDRAMDDINNTVVDNNGSRINLKQAKNSAHTLDDTDNIRSSARAMADKILVPPPSYPSLQADASPVVLTNVQDNVQSTLPTNVQENSQAAPPSHVQANGQTASLNENRACSSSFGPCSLNTRGTAPPYADWGTGKKLELQFNKYMIPVGPNRKKFASQLGVLARNGILLPLTYTDWRAKGFKTQHQRCWNEIKDNTNVPEAYRRKCLKDVGRKWNNWKAIVRRKYYLAFETDEERLENCPDRVQPDQWVKLVKYWGRPEVQERCRKNKTIRRRQVGLHRSGRKAHLQVAEELKAQGKRHDRVAVYIATHRKKNSNEPSDAASGENIARMEEQLNQATPEEQASDDFRESVFVGVMGPDTRGRVRTMGSGPCPSEIFGGRYGTVASSHDLERLSGEIRTEIRNELREEIRDEIRNELRGELRSELRNELRDEFNELMMGQMREIEMRLRATGSFPTQRLDSPGVHAVLPHAPPAPQTVLQATSSNSHAEVGAKADQGPPRVALLSLGQKREVVACGFFISKDSQKIVNGEPLGPGYYEVQVVKVVQPEYKLLKAKKPSLLTLGDAVKKSVAWPTYLVSKIK